jgi:pantetheine-phosphate adenylyltransferase
MRLAIYAGSFDPFTRGHLEVLRGAAKSFDRVLLAVGINRRKPGFLDPTERVILIQEVLAEQHFQREIARPPEVCTFEGLLIDLCETRLHRPVELGPTETRPDSVSIVRGLRAVSDFEVEMGIADANRRLNGRFQTVFIPTPAEMAFVSSSTVRELLSFKVSDSHLMPYLTPAAIKHLRGPRWPTEG